MTFFFLMSLLSTIGAQRLSRLPPCPASCVVCSETAVICHRLTNIIDTPLSIQALMLTEGFISTVLPASLSDLNNLTLIALSHNRVSWLSETSFRNLSLLHTLLLDHNLLSSQTLQGGALAGLAHLQLLSLANNHITMMRAGWLEGTRALRSLQLEGNRLTSLDPASFPLRDLRNLENLDLSDNLLEHLHRDSLRGLVGLRSLDLSRNRLSCAPGEVFSYLSLLNNLNMELNTWNCSCQLLELSAFLSSFIQQPDKVLYNGRRIVCVSADNPAVTTVLELNEANCFPSNQNITVKMVAGPSITPQVYGRDLTITAVVCFTGGVGLTLMVVFISYQVSRRKKENPERRVREQEGRGSIEDAPGVRQDLTLPANSSQPWDGEDWRSHRSRVAGDRCPHCRGPGPDGSRGQDGSEEGTREEVERQKRMMMMMMMMEEEEEEERSRSWMRHHHRVALNRDLATSGGLSNGGPGFNYSSQREAAPHGIPRAGTRPAYKTERQLRDVGTDGDARSTAGLRRFDCENCHRTYNPRPAGGAYPPGSQRRQSHREGEGNTEGADYGWNQGTKRRGSRNVRFNLESLEALLPLERRREGKKRDGESRSREKEKRKREKRRDAGEERSGRRRTRVQSSRLLRVKLNLSPVGKNKVHPKKTSERRHKESISRREERGGDKRMDKNRSTRWKEKKQRDETAEKPEASAEGEESEGCEGRHDDDDDNGDEEENEEGRKETSSKEKTPIYQTQEGSEGGKHHHRNHGDAETADQSEPSRSAEASAVGQQQIGPPTNGQMGSLQSTSAQSVGEESTLQMPLQPSLLLSATDSNGTTNPSILGIISSSLPGSNLPPQRGNLLNLAQTTTAMLPSNVNSGINSNVNSAIGPNVAFPGLHFLKRNMAASGDAEPQCFSVHGGLRPNASASSLLANLSRSNPMLGSAINASPTYTQSAESASSLAIYQGTIQSLSQSPMPPENISLVPRVSVDRPQRSGFQSGEEPHSLAPHPSELHTREEVHSGPQLQGDTGITGKLPLDYHASGSLAEAAHHNLAPGGSVAGGGASGGEGVVTGEGGVSGSHGSGGGQAIVRTQATNVALLGGVATMGSLSSAGFGSLGVDVFSVEDVASAAGMSTVEGVNPKEGRVPNEGGVPKEGGVPTGGMASAGSPAATLLQQEYLSEEGGSSPKRKLKLVLPEKPSSRPPTALERKIR